jgi:hypothetical protein
MPSSRTLILAGFGSRWMTPWSCAASSASAICPSRARVCRVRSRRARPRFRRRPRCRDGSGKRASAPHAETRLTVWIAGEGVWQHLDRHLAAEARVDSAIRGAHSTGPEDAADFIVAEPGTWRDTHQREILRESPLQADSGSTANCGSDGRSLEACTALMLASHCVTAWRSPSRCAPTRRRSRERTPRAAERPRARAR